MKFLFLDVETTGLNPVGDGLIQVAGIIEIDGEVREEFNIRMKPYKGEMVSQKALAVNGISLKELREYPDPAESYRKIKAILGKYVDKYDKKDKLYLVGQNVGFDYEFLRWFFVKNNDRYLGSFIHYHKVDLIAISTVMKIAGKLKTEDLKLATLMKEFDLGGQTHDALDDIRFTREIFYIYVDWVKTGSN